MKRSGPRTEPCGTADVRVKKIACEYIYWQPVPVTCMGIQIIS